MSKRKTDNPRNSTSFRKSSLATRFHASYEKLDNGCWEWIGFLHTGHSRGIITSNKKHLLAHRVSWEIHNGEIKDGLFVCHHCDNPKCVNPQHLFLGTSIDNMEDRDSKGRQAQGTRHGNYIHGKYTNQARWRTRADGTRYFFNGNSSEKSPITGH